MRSDWFVVVGVLHVCLSLRNAKGRGAGCTVGVRVGDCGRARWRDQIGSAACPTLSNWGLIEWQEAVRHDVHVFKYCLRSDYECLSDLRHQQFHLVMCLLPLPTQRRCCAICWCLIVCDVIQHAADVCGACS